MLVRPLLAGLLGALLLGCGGGGEEERPRSAPKALPGSPPEVEAALLSAEDLGDGWVDIGPTPVELRGMDGCPATNVLTSGEDAGRIGEAQSVFQQGEGPAPTFFESVSLWKSDRVAQERLETFRTATTSCVGVSEQMPGGGQATVTFTERRAPDLGDETVGQTVRFDFDEGPDAALDLIAVRLGDVVVLTTGERHDGDATTSLGPARLEELTRQAVEQVERSLPRS